MDFDLAQPSRFLITILKSFGLWHLDTKWETLYKIYAYILHSIFTFLNIATMWASVITAKDIEQFTESLYMSLTEAALMVKVVNIFRLSREAMDFFHLIESKDLSLKNSNEKQIFQSANRVFHIVAKFYISASVASVVFRFTAVAAGDKWVLPYPAWMPFDLHSEYYWYAYGFQFIGMILTCLTNVAIDMLQCYLLHHLSLIYRVIGHRLATIGFALHATCDVHKMDELVLKELTEIVKAHELVKRITTKCERFISVPFFMQVLLSALILCFTGYQIQNISPLENPGQFIEMVDLLFVLGLQIFLPCYYGNQVTIQSSKLSEALYNSNWIVLPQKSKKLVYIYMEFLKEPVHVKAGKFFNIGLATFSKTINNAYSYFAVLIQMKN